MNKSEAELFVESIRLAARAKFVPVMRDETAKLLAKTVAEAQPERILEIGTSVGTSGITALINAENSTLTTVDNDLDVLEQAKENFRVVGVYDRVNIICGDCSEVAAMLTGSYDFAVIDGPKSRYKELTERIMMLMPRGGVIFVDDIGYHDKLKESVVQHKHRTIVTNMKEYIAYIKTLNAELYDVEDGAAIIKVKKG